MMARQVSEMDQFSRLVFKATLICALLLCSCESTSIRLSPSGMVIICPRGQALLTCERISGFILYWDVSVPHLASATTQRIIPSQGVLLSPEFKIGFTELNITRTSENPLISQLLINNVTIEINGTTIYCSEDGNETNAPMIAIDVIHKNDALQSADRSLNVTLVNQLLRKNSVTVTLQWPREAGAVYHVNVLPEISQMYTELTTMSHDIFTINLTISYNIQYNVSIVSSLCGVTTTKVLNYVTCNYSPTQLLHGPVVVGSQDSPPIEGQFITYTCPPGFILTGPNMSVCTENRELEPDPGEVDCIADCGVPLMNRYVKLNYTSTLDGSVLTLTCENEMSNINTTDEQILKVTCHGNGSWIPDPAKFIKSCSSFTTVPPEMSSWTPVVQTGTANLIAVFSSIIIIVCIVSSIVFLSIGYACGRFGHKHKQSHTSTTMSDPAEKYAGSNEQSQLSQTPGPLYEELQPKSTPECQDLVELKDNVAYGPIVK